MEIISITTKSNYLIVDDNHKEVNITYNEEGNTFNINEYEFTTLTFISVIREIFNEQHFKSNGEKPTFDIMDDEKIRKLYPINYIIDLRKKYPESNKGIINDKIKNKWIGYIKKECEEKTYGETWTNIQKHVLNAGNDYLNDLREWNWYQTQLKQYDYRNVPANIMVMWEFYNYVMKQHMKLRN